MKAEEIKARNEYIIQFHNAGFTTYLIAEAYGLTESIIERIIRYGK